MLSTLLLMRLMVSQTGDDTFSQPPLVPSEQPPAAGLPPEAGPDGVYRLPGPVANASLPVSWPRVGLETLAGIGSGVGGGLVGGLIGARINPSNEPLRLSGLWVGAAIGFGVLVPLATALVHHLMGGQGRWWACLLGTVVGAALGTAAMVWGGTVDVGVPLFALASVAGATIGIEVSAPSSAEPR